MDCSSGTVVTGQGEWPEAAGGEMEMGCEAEILPCEGGEALAQVAQRSRGCPWLPGSVQGQVGWDFGQPGLVEGVPAHGRGWNWMGFKVPSNPNQSGIL